MPSYLNTLTNKNVSIKCTRSNKICISSPFNFLSSVSLEMVVIRYSLLSNDDIYMTTFYVNNLCKFFLDLRKLEELRQYLYLKSKKYPFSEKFILHCRKLAKEVPKYDFCGFEIHCRLSKSTKSITGSLDVNSFFKEVSHKELKMPKTLSPSDFKDIV